MRELHKLITRWAARAEKIITKARSYARSRHEAAEYAEYIAVVALIAVALGVGLHVLHPFAADALDNAMNTISDSL
jgi:hypothetical protein